MFKTQKSPLFLVALAFATGIALSAAFASPGFWGLGGMALATAVLFVVSRRKMWPRVQQTVQIALGVCFVAAGWVLGEVSAIVPQDDPSQYVGQSIAATGYVVDDVRATKSGYRTVFQCETPVVGKVMLYLPKGPVSLATNDRLSLTLALEPLSQRNPGYANWLQHQGIHASAKATEISVVGHQSGILPMFTDLRGTICKQMKASFPDSLTAGLSNAMLLGDRSGLDMDLKKSFSATGLSHIVAISGMNFAIIYLVLCFLLKPLLYLRYGRQLRSLIIVPLMVFFALLAGANPAIVRAAIMLSMLDLGQSFWNKSNSLNALATSALLFLGWDPQSLFSPDFQLSYAAVLGILMFQNPILHYFHQRMKWLPQSIASALAVTLAAQAATTPLVAWHFQSFPTYFLLANMLVLPLVTLVVQIGFAGFLLVWIPGVNEVWGGVMDFMLWAISAMADLLAQLPGATITGLDAAQTGIWMVLAQVLVGFLVLERRFLRRALAYLRGSEQAQLAGVARTGLQVRVLAVPAVMLWVLIGFLIS
jgi:ComEC/Rec2-related protein